jgi:integrase
VMGSVSGTPELMAKVLYGTGLRLKECRRLRVTDLDCAPQQIVVRDGNGMEARVTMRPASLVGPLQEPCARVHRVHAHDVAQGYGAVFYRSPWHDNTPVPAALGCGQMIYTHVLNRGRMAVRSLLD